MNEPYIYEPHSFSKTIVGKAYCSNCGLILLNNRITRWCVKKGCNHEDHPSWKQTLKELTRYV